MDGHVERVGVTGNNGEIKNKSRRIIIDLAGEGRNRSVGGNTKAEANHATQEQFESQLVPEVPPMELLIAHGLIKSLSCKVNNFPPPLTRRVPFNSLLLLLLHKRGNCTQLTTALGVGKQTKPICPKCF